MVAKINKKKYDGHAIASFVIALISAIIWFFFKGNVLLFFIAGPISTFLGIIATIEIKHSDKLRGDSLAWIGITASIMMMLSKMSLNI